MDFSVESAIYQKKKKIEKLIDKYASQHLEMSKTDKEKHDVLTDILWTIKSSPERASWEAKVKKVRRIYDMARAYEEEIDSRGDVAAKSHGIDSRSKNYVNKIFESVETMSARIVWRIMRNKPFVNVSPSIFNSSEGDSRKARVIEYIIQKQFEKSGLRTELIKVTRQMFLSTFGVLKVIWEDSEEAKSPTNRLFSDYSGQKVISVDPLNVFIDNAATSLRDISFVIEKKITNLSNILNNDEYVNKDVLISRQSSMGTDLPIDENGNTKSSADADPIIEIYEYWSGDIFAVFTDEVLLYYDDNIMGKNFIPYVFWGNIEKENTPYCDSEIMKIVDLVDEKSAMRRMRLDLVKRALLPKLLTERSNQVDEKALRAFNKSIVTTADVSKVLPLNLSNYSGVMQALNENALIDKDIQAMTGSGDYTSVRTSGEETATGVQAIMEAMEARFVAKMLSAGEFLERLFESFRMLDYYYWNEKNIFLDAPSVRNALVSSGDSNYVKVDDTDFKGDFTIVSTAAALSMTPETVRANAMNLFQSLYGNPLVHERALLEVFISSIDPTLVDKLLSITSEQAVAATQEAMQASTEANGQMMGGMGGMPPQMGG